MTGYWSGRRCLLSFLLLLAVLLALVTVAAAGAESNSVYIEPESATAGEGQPAVVDLVAEPGESGLAAWVLEVAFDADVASTSSRQCDPVDTPAGAAGAVGCEAVDTDGDGKDDTVKAFGGVIFTNTGKGFTRRVVLASIEFEAVGEASACSELTVRVTAFADPEGNETNPAGGNGEVCVAGPGRTPGPIRTPGVDAPSPGETGTGATAGTPGASPEGGVVPGGETPQATGGAPQTGGSAGTSAGGRSPAGTGPGGGTGLEGGGSGGPSTAAWVLIGLGAAVLAGAAAYTGYRLRRASRT